MKLGLAIILSIISIMVVSGCTTTNSPPNTVNNTVPDNPTISPAFTVSVPENGSGFNSIAYDGTFVLFRSTTFDPNNFYAGVTGGEVLMTINYNRDVSSTTAKMICNDENGVIFDYSTPINDILPHQNIGDCQYSNDKYKKGNTSADLMFRCYYVDSRCTIDSNCTGSPWSRKVRFAISGGKAFLIINFNFLGGTQTQNLDCTVNIQSEDPQFEITKSFKVRYDAER